MGNETFHPYRVGIPIGYFISLRSQTISIGLRVPPKVKTFTFFDGNLFPYRNDIGRQ